MRLLHGVLFLCALFSASASPSLGHLSRRKDASGQLRERSLPQLPRYLSLLRGGSGALGGGKKTTDVTASVVGTEAVPPHAQEVSAYLEHMGISSHSGLSEERAKNLLTMHGANRLEVDHGDPLWKLFAAQFDDRLVQILLGVAALSYALARIEGEPNGWVEPAVILGILLLNALVGTWQEASAASALDALQKLQPETARCLREGRWVHDLDAAELVPGDIIELRVGDRVPADARLVSLATTTLSADEGSLTGTRPRPRPRP